MGDPTLSIVELMLRLLWKVEVTTGKHPRDSGAYAFVMPPGQVLAFMAEAAGFGWVPCADTRDEGVFGVRGRTIGWFHDVPILERDDAAAGLVQLLRLEDLEAWDNQGEEGL